MGGGTTGDGGRGRDVFFVVYCLQCLFVVFVCSFAAERASCVSSPAALQSELVSSGPST